MEQKTFSNLLKLVIIGVFIFGSFICFYVVPALGQSLLNMYPEFAYAYWPWLIFLWIAAIPCYTALVFAWLISGNIGKDKSFSMENAGYLKWIAWLAAGDSAYFFLGNIVLMFLNMNHPGILLVSMVVVFVGMAITVATACLSHMTRKAAALQEQSDLTI